MMNRTEAEAREAFAAFRELRTGNLVTNHVFFSGCVEYGYPCQYSNGPCCCEPGCCPFGQEEKRLDDDFVEEQLAKLHLNSDITRAKENIRRARAIIQSWQFIREERKLLSFFCVFFDIFLNFLFKKAFDILKMLMYMPTCR